ncbi:MAG: lysophospholipid acyltransferase family protein [Pseudomonadota bacterium]
MPSPLFAVLIYGVMGVMGVIGIPALLSDDWSRRWKKLYCKIVFRLLRAVYGIRVTVEGEVPRGDVLIAAKHQSLLDVLIIYHALEKPRFVMKRELMWTPVFGLYARRSGAVPIDRRPRHGAAKELVEAFEGVKGQIVIYPQGTRVAPGATAPYRRGITRMAEATGRPVIPAATNSGLFWAKGGRMQGPGTAVVRFGPTFAGDLPAAELMTETVSWIEIESRELAGLEPL